MAVRYQIDGNIFREITTHWLCASINEFLIKARKTETDRAGDTVEYLQLNDGRVFMKSARTPRRKEVARNSKAGLRNQPPATSEPLTQPH